MCGRVFYMLLCTFHSYGSALATLYWRLGWEVGVVSRILATNGINWGYFFDHNPFEPHCNQHPNNFVVLPPVCKREIFNPIIIIDFALFVGT